MSMDPQKIGPDKGSVMTCILSPNGEIILVKNEGFKKPFWKLPGGHINPEGESVAAAAIRECREETGIRLLQEEMSFHSWHRHNGALYIPHLCIAKVTQKKFNTRHKFGREDDQTLLIEAFPTAKVLEIPDLLGRHKILIAEVFARPA